MAYTHGTKWSDDLIKQQVLEVVQNLNLDRMPSNKEVADYFNNYKLANAISKYKGWYSLANELGLGIKKTDTYFGKQYERIATDMLVERGYEVTQMSQNFPYDLLVNNSIKVDVKVSRLFRGNNGNFFSFNIEKPFATCDIYILFLIENEEKIKTMLIIPSKFVVNNTQISVGAVHSKYYKFADKWDYFQNYSNFMESVS